VAVSAQYCLRMDTNKPALDQLLTTQDALKALRIGRTNFYARLKAGDLDAVKIGRRTYVRQSAIQTFVQALKPYRSTQT